MPMMPNEVKAEAIRRSYLGRMYANVFFILDWLSESVFPVPDGLVGSVSAGDFISPVISEMLPFFFCSSSEVSIIIAGEPQFGQKRGLSIGKPSKSKPLLHKLQNIGTHG